MPRLLWLTAWPPGAVFLRRLTSVAGRPRFQRLLPDAVPQAPADSAHQMRARVAFPLLLSNRLHARSTCPSDAGYLHVVLPPRESDRRCRSDFVIGGGFKGPGRFLGCVVGIRVLSPDDMSWYGEGEFKFYRDGDEALPTICGTGLEDYVGSAWGIGPHTTPYAGVPIHVAPPTQQDGLLGPIPRFRRLLPMASSRSDGFPRYIHRHHSTDWGGRRALVARSRRLMRSAGSTRSPETVGPETFRAHRSVPLRSPNGATTTAQPRSSIAASRNRYPAWTSAAAVADIGRRNYEGAPA